MIIKYAILFYSGKLIAGDVVSSYTMMEKRLHTEPRLDMRKIRRACLNIQFKISDSITVEYDNNKIQNNNFKRVYRKYEFS